MTEREAKQALKELSYAEKLLLRELLRQIRKEREEAAGGEERREEHT